MPNCTHNGSFRPSFSRVSSIWALVARSPRIDMIGSIGTTRLITKVTAKRPMNVTKSVKTVVPIWRNSDNSRDGGAGGAMGGGGGLFARKNGPPQKKGARLLPYFVTSQ